jgi:site-specific recombinase XerD
LRAGSIAMTDTKKPRRKTLYSYGRHGDRVRVLIDSRRDRVEVHYRDLFNVPRKRVFPNDKQGREESIAWADVFKVEREKARHEGDKPKAITTRGLWTAYLNSPAWTNLRPASQVTYRNRWAKWEGFIRKDSDAAKVKATDVDEFIVLASKVMALYQVRQVFNVARTVHKWGQTRDLLLGTVFAVYRWRQPRDAQPTRPDEYTEAEWVRLISKSEPQHPKKWRLNVALLICHASGQRIQAVRHLREQDIAADSVTWPAAWQKQGKPLTRPLTWDLVAALETARHWRQVAATGRVRRDRKAGSRPAALSRSDWVLFAQNEKSKPVSYSSLHTMLGELETLAKVKHRDLRGFHGFRRKVVGDLGERLGDRTAGLEYVGDTDVSQLASYDRREGERMKKAAAEMEDGQ